MTGLERRFAQHMDPDGFLGTQLNGIGVKDGAQRALRFQISLGG
jgi:hypothetical protein